MSNIDIVYFDMGNTLVNFKNNKKKTLDSSIEETICYINRHYGINITHELFKMYYKEWQEKVRTFETENKEADILLILNDFFKRYGLIFTEKEAIQLYKVLYHQTFENAQLEPFVFEALLELKKENYKMGIISNMPVYGDVASEILRVLKIDKFFDYCLFSYDIRICKPSLEIFKKAVLDNNIPAQNSIMIGDSLKNDYFPARQIKMHPILYGASKEYDSFDNYKLVMKKVKRYERN